MRLWSLHPSYLDAKGLVALWREGLLAKAVLNGQTRGYINHPQLERFKAHPQTQNAINAYLWDVVEEADRRGYNFNHTKLKPEQACARIPVSNGQLAYEFQHLQTKLKARNPEQYKLNQSRKTAVLPHPLITITTGDIAGWERSNR